VREILRFNGLQGKRKRRRVQLASNLAFLSFPARSETLLRFGLYSVDLARALLHLKSSAKILA
jgi:hypothetical protein